VNFRHPSDEYPSARMLNDSGSSVFMIDYLDNLVQQSVVRSLRSCKDTTQLSRPRHINNVNSSQVLLRNGWIHRVFLPGKRSRSRGSAMKGSSFYHISLFLFSFSTRSLSSLRKNILSPVTLTSKAKIEPPNYLNAVNSVADGTPYLWRYRTTRRCMGWSSRRKRRI